MNKLTAAEARTISGVNSLGSKAILGSVNRSIKKSAESREATTVKAFPKFRVQDGAVKAAVSLLEQDGFSVKVNDTNETIKITVSWA
ncbi:hypothetical protein [Paraglaciecola polaris]|uniref:Uncharacterized protein n=1 Tax=Paraglaciecola polaris LMG 21857 TaxID=1129793 RepID=K6YGL2_9ALTE|nr:hypothetical protein [Paraglaciecola polaris]GAC31854.1 hypothetical protein GPLA_0938 [Paraglaciecola polaris LMG 21857]